MKHSLLRLCGAGALVLPLSVGAASQQGSAQDSFYTQATTRASGGSLEMFNRLQSQAQDINQLRGQIEELRHQLEQQQSLSQQRYLDLEEQLSQMSQSGAASSTESGGGNATAEDDDPINQAASGGGGAADSGAAQSGSASSSSNDAETAYRDAFALVREREFEAAITAFQDFNRDYPDSGLAGNAWYWLGELYSAQSQLDQSASAFQTVIDDYPENGKIADAIYKLGLVYARQGESDQSREMLDRVISEHGDSDAAEQARGFLEQTSG